MGERGRTRGGGLGVGLGRSDWGGRTGGGGLGIGLGVELGGLDWGGRTGIELGGW